MSSLPVAVAITLRQTLPISLAQSVLPSLLLILTTKRSPLRYLWILCALWLYHQFLTLWRTLPFVPVYCSMVGAQNFLSAVQAVNFLIINPLDREDLVRAKIFPGSASLPVQLWHTTITFFCSPRGVNTPWVAKNLPQHPRFITRQAKPKIPRTAFLIRQAAVLVWQVLLMDVMYLLTLQDDSPKKPFVLADYKYFEADAEEWAKRVIVSLATWFIGVRLLLDSAYRVFTLLTVGLGLWTPEELPPFFGSMWDAYTLRSYWGKFWHQALRWPFTTVSNWLTRSVLGLPRLTTIERYTNNFLVLFQSGILHFLADYLLGVPVRESGAIVFYSMFVVGYIIEDGVQGLWKRVAGPGEGSSVGPPPLWQRFLGAVWVCAWMSVTAPRYLYPQEALPVEGKQMFPVDIAQRIGLPMGVVGIVVGGVLLEVVFKVEI